MSGSGPIAIWRLSPDLLAAVAALPDLRLSPARLLLSDEEQRRAHDFHSEKDRRLYVTAHIALRVVLSRQLGLPPSLLEIGAEGRSKPRLVGPSSKLPLLRFNLAHTRRAIVIATTTDCEVGIDIEQHRPISDLESLARGIMSPMELSVWESLAPDSRLPALYGLWTRKEAYLKAIGLGLFRELRAVTVPVIPAYLAEPVLVEDRGEPLPWAHWNLCDLPTWQDFSAALCWQAAKPLPGAVPQLQIQDLSMEDLFPRDFSAYHSSAEN